MLCNVCGRKFALYGFPESHAASFALLAYASAYFKVKDLAAFTCALLNNQPMGFYSPAVLVDDTKRHGLRVKAIDVQVSRWPCTIEAEADGSLSMRMGLGYAKGLRKESAEAIVAAREEGGKFRSAEDLALRVPSLNRKELTILARVGALNSIDGVAHRRDALWQVERAGKLEGPLFRQRSERLEEDAQSQPLQQMNVEDRLVADYGGTGLTIGKHPMHYRRQALYRQGVLTASELQKRRNGEYVKTAGLAIVKQRPGTAKGVVFMSAADETGIFNIIVTKDFFEANKLTIKRCKFFLVEGKLQNEDNVVHIQAKRITQLSNNGLALSSHDFH